MSKIKEIKIRIKSVKNINRVTKSMQNIAISKLKKAETAAKAGKEFNQKLNQMYENLYLQEHFIPQSQTNKKLIVMFGPNKGFTGSMLGGLYSEAKKYFSSFDRTNLIGISVGKKIGRYLKSFVSEVKADFSSISSKPTDVEIRAVSNYVEKIYMSGEVSEVYVVFVDYINSLIQKPVVRRVLPSQKEKMTLDLGTDQFLIEPTRTQVFDSVFKLYLQNTLYQVNSETFASELAARANSMKKASEKSEELSSVLTLELNKIRQESITRELAEISSGAFV